MLRICRVWQGYVQDLFDDVRSVAYPNSISSNAFLAMVLIMESEMVYALLAFKNRKILGGTTYMRRCSNWWILKKFTNYLTQSMTSQHSLTNIHPCLERDTILYILYIIYCTKMLQPTKGYVYMPYQLPKNIWQHTAWSLSTDLAKNRHW